MGTMRAFVVAALAFGLLSIPSNGMAWAAEPISVAPEDGLSIDQESLDQLFKTLATPGDAAIGEAAEGEIERRWLQSGSDTIDLLMLWAQQAIAAKDYPRANDFLDAVTTLKPSYAEGWNRRATLFFLEQQYGKALSDIEKVLAIEPRHFGALAGLGLILQEIDQKPTALAALKKALAINPYLDDSVKNAVRDLEPSVEGHPI